LGALAAITASNQVRIGNSNVTSIGGRVAWSTVSDARFKKDIQENVIGLDFILNLRPVTYHFDREAMSKYLQISDSLENDASRAASQENTLHTGFIAQEVEQTARSVGYDFSGVDAPKNDSDYYGLRYAEFVVPLVKATQEQQQIIETQTEKLEELQQQIEAQRDEIEKLKSLVNALLKK